MGKSFKKFIYLPFLCLCLGACGPKAPEASDETLKPAMATFAGSGDADSAALWQLWQQAFTGKLMPIIDPKLLGARDVAEALRTGQVVFSANLYHAENAPKPEAGEVALALADIAIVPVIHVEGVQIGTLVLTAATLDDIYQGRITRWNDAALVALNPEIRLPDAAIRPLMRADDTALTTIMNQYRRQHGYAVQSHSRLSSFPVANRAAMITEVESVANSLGYVTHHDAMTRVMNYVALVNQTGDAILPRLKQIEKAQNHQDGWPLVATLWLRFYPEKLSCDQQQSLAEFLAVIRRQDHPAAASHGLVPRQNSIQWTPSSHCLSGVD